MDQLVIQLPTALREFVEAESKLAGLEAPADFVRALIQEAHQRRHYSADSQGLEELKRIHGEDKVMAALEREAEEGLKSGPPVPWDPANHEEMKRRVLAQFGRPVR